MIMALSYKSKWELQDWSNDIAAFERYKNLYLKYHSPFALKRMKEIQDKWPYHNKHMVIPSDKT